MTDPTDGGCGACGRGFLEGHEPGCPGLKVSPKHQKVELAAGYRFEWDAKDPRDETKMTEPLLHMPVLIESPFGRNPDGSKATPEVYRRNTIYVRRAIADSLSRGEAPFGSHALYPLVLHDPDEAQRRHGMEAGFSIGSLFPVVAMYVDYGVTPGMKEGIERWGKLGKPILGRHIGENGPEHEHLAEAPPTAYPDEAFIAGYMACHRVWAKAFPDTAGDESGAEQAARETLELRDA